MVRNNTRKIKNLYYNDNKKQYGQILARLRYIKIIDNNNDIQS